VSTYAKRDEEKRGRSGKGGNVISQRGSRSFSSNGPPTIIRQDLDDRIAPRARRQTLGIRSHVAGDIFPPSLSVSFFISLDVFDNSGIWKTVARRRIWGETKEDTGQISGLYTLYSELMLIVGELVKGGRRRKWNYALMTEAGRFIYEIA